MANDLVGMHVGIVVSDPWEFGTAHGSGPFDAEIIQAGPNPNRRGKDIAALVRLKLPLQFEGTDCEYFVAQVRHEGTTMDVLRDGRPVHCNLTRVPVERASGPSALDLSWWRGGISLI